MTYETNSINIVSYLIDLAIVYMKDLTPDERLEVYQELYSHYCRYCGCKQPENYKCVCWNDK